MSDMHTKDGAAAPIFPFAAIVGQPQLKTALMLCAVDPSLGGVLIRGDKGTAKSTAARALAAVLPRLSRRPGCAFNCAPGAASSHCTACAADDAAAFTDAGVPFVTLPLGATEDRVVGTLDLERALQGAGKSFQPGLLAAAHRGILYIDEVNLLADHLVDVLLDVAAMGVNAVQRDGLAISHPARFTLVGTMNGEEGDLRPQLLDRFGLMVEVTAPRDKALRAEVVRRRIAFEADPSRFAAAWEDQQAALTTQLAAAQALLPRVALADALLDLVSHLCCEFEVASLRADIVLYKGARALAALDGRPAVTPADIRAAAELVLPHRRRRKPFEQPGLDQDRLDELMKEAGEEPRAEDSHGADAGDGKADDDDAGGAAPDSGGEEGGNNEGGGSAQPQVFAAAAAPDAPRLVIDAPGLLAGRRSAAFDAPRGRMLHAVRDAHPESVAVAATLRSAALRDPANPRVTRADLHRQVRVGQTANLILFVVDASGSMAAQRRMEAVKGAVLSLLTDAYQRRDEVAVISFRGEAAQLLLAPTRSVERAEQSLRELPTGGRTPLPHALQLALETLERAREDTPPLLVLLSDGRANVALENGVDVGDPWSESLALASLLAARGVPALVLDTESGFLRLGRAAQLAQALGAECLTIEQLSAEKLTLTIRGHL
jgi:magnesium chelatase subunit D